MKSLWKKLHLPAVLTFVGQLVGVSDLIASNPKIAVDNLPHLGLSPEWAAVLVAACTFAQAVQRAIHAGDKIEVPKPNVTPSR